MDNIGSGITECREILQEQLEKAKGSLNLVDTNLKKFVTKTPSAMLRPPPKRLENYDSVADKWKSMKDNNFKNDLRNTLSRRRMKGFDKADAENIPERRRMFDTQPKILQCSISGPPVVADYESEEEIDRRVKKPALSSYVVAKPVVIPSRKEAVSAKTSSETRARDRRMFGALLGTLKKFRQEENNLKDKIEKKAKVEKKLEDAARQERERVRQETTKLFRARKERELYIKAVESHIRRVKDQEEWEELQKPLFNFIRTKKEPYIFYLPNIHNEHTEKLLEDSRQQMRNEVEERRSEIKKGVDKILERWNVDNLEQIPDVFRNLPEINNSETHMPFENIHATVTVKPQRSPIEIDDDDIPLYVKKEKGLNDAFSSSEYDSITVKTEKPDADEAVRDKFALSDNIRVKEERDDDDEDRSSTASKIEMNDVTAIFSSKNKHTRAHNDSDSNANVINQNSNSEICETSCKSGNDSINKNSNNTDVPTTLNLIQVIENGNVNGIDDNIHIAEVTNNRDSNISKKKAFIDNSNCNSKEHYINSGTVNTNKESVKHESGVTDRKRKHSLDESKHHKNTEEKPNNTDPSDKDIKTSGDGPSCNKKSSIVKTDTDNIKNKTTAKSSSKNNKKINKSQKTELDNNKKNGDKRKKDEEKDIGKRNKDNVIDKKHGDQTKPRKLELSSVKKNDLEKKGDKYRSSAKYRDARSQSRSKKESSIKRKDTKEIKKDDRGRSTKQRNYDRNDKNTKYRNHSRSSSRRSSTTTSASCSYTSSGSESYSSGSSDSKSGKKLVKRHRKSSNYSSSSSTN